MHMQSKQPYTPCDQPRLSPRDKSSQRVKPAAASEHTHGWAASRTLRLSTVAIAAGLLVAITAASAFGWSTRSPGVEGALAAKRRPISPASAFVLPSTKQCVSGQELTIRLRKLPHVRWIGATVKVNGKQVLTIKRSRIAAAVKLAGLPIGRLALSITVTASNGRRVTATRNYQTCAPTPTSVQPPAIPHPPVPHPPVAPQPPVTPQPPSSPAQGSYTGSDPQSIEHGGITFYVSPAGNLQDVTVERTRLGCAPSKVLYNHFEMAELPVGADGSFSQESEQAGMVETAYKEFEPAHITYTLSGQLLEGHATGVFREDVTYDNGTKYACSTDNQSWTASRDEDQGVASLPATEGHYTGNDPQSIEHGGVAFYVSPGGNLQDVAIQTTRLGCGPTKEIYDHFEMAEVPVATDGSFSQHGEQEGMVETAYKEYEPAHFAYSFSGHVHGAGASGEQRIAGVYREDITYDNGTKHECSTSNQSWTATRDEQSQSPASFPAEEGSYTGNDPQNKTGGEVKFYVSPGGNLQDVAIQTTRLGCGPTKEIYDHFEMAEVPVATDGSFSQHGEQEGMVETAYKEYEPAHFAYSFSGHVHGAGASGEQRIAGVYREDITYDNGTKHECSTSNQSWTATRDEQQGPASFPATAGSYLGSDPQGIEHGAVAFSVSPSGNLQSVTVQETQLGCGPTKEIYDHFEMGEVSVAGDGSFLKKTEQTRLVETAYKEFNEAHITYTFSGHVHGANAAGKQRIAGVYREDITYDNGTKYACSTSNQSWTASHA